MTHFGNKHINVCLNFVLDSGSVISKPCTKTSNTICECLKGFVPSDEDFSTCRCNAGFGKSSGGKEANYKH